MHARPAQWAPIDSFPGVRDPAPMRALALAFSFALLALPATAQAPAILLKSGNAAPGQTDPLLTYLPGPSTSGFGAQFTTNDFASARTGPQATVRSTIAGGWPAFVPQDPTALWVDTTGGSSSALYAIPFTIGAPLASDVLTMQFSADDFLGEATVAGVYVNEMPVAGTNNVGGYYFVETIQRDIGPMLLQGQNWLYVYLRNTGGQGGLLFSARIQPDGGLVRTFGTGCIGSNGTPLMLAGATSTQPGATALLSFYSLPSGTPVILALGVSNATSFGLPAPVDLGFLGFAGCSGLVEPVSSVILSGTNGGAQFAYLPGGPVRRAVGVRTGFRDRPVRHARGLGHQRCRTPWRLVIAAG